MSHFKDERLSMWQYKEPEFSVAIGDICWARQAYYFNMFWPCVVEEIISPFNEEELVLTLAMKEKKQSHKKPILVKFLWPNDAKRWVESVAPTTNELLPWKTDQDVDFYINEAEAALLKANKKSLKVSINDVKKPLIDVLKSLIENANYLHDKNLEDNIVSPSIRAGCLISFYDPVAGCTEDSFYEDKKILEIFEESNMQQNDSEADSNDFENSQKKKSTTVKSKSSGFLAGFKHLYPLLIQRFSTPVDRTHEIQLVRDHAGVVLNPVVRRPIDKFRLIRSVCFRGGFTNEQENRIKFSKIEERVRRGPDASCIAEDKPADLAENKPPEVPQLSQKVVTVNVAKEKSLEILRKNLPHEFSEPSSILQEVRSSQFVPSLPNLALKNPDIAYSQSKFKFLDDDEMEVKPKSKKINDKPTNSKKLVNQGISSKFDLISNEDINEPIQTNLKNSKRKEVVSKRKDSLPDQSIKKKNKQIEPETDEFDFVPKRKKVIKDSDFESSP